MNTTLGKTARQMSNQAFEAGAAHVTKAEVAVEAGRTTGRYADHTPLVCSDSGRRETAAWTRCGDGHMGKAFDTLESSVVVAVGKRHAGEDFRPRPAEG
jgi:hypothetical protein